MSDDDDETESETLEPGELTIYDPPKPTPIAKASPDGVLQRYPGIASQRFTAEQQAVLEEPVPSDDVDILPTGECLDPETPVLRANLSWDSIGNLKLGDELLTLEEHAHNKYRRMRAATVLAVVARKKDRLCLTLADGRQVVCSPEHPWLATFYSRKPLHTYHWASTSALRVGDEISNLGQPWETDESRSGGYLAGLYDGEGSLIRTLTPGSGVDGSRGRYGVTFAQNPGPVLETAIRELKVRGYRPTDPRMNGRGPRCLSIDVNGLYDTLRLLGSLRPQRLLAGSYSIWNGKAFMLRGQPKVAIESIERLGSGELVDIQTTSGTFLANGIVSHNCYFSQVGYRRRLAKTFGPGGWALVPTGDFYQDGETLCREYSLFAEGRFISSSIGEADFQPNNPRYSKATAAESLKSNALMRCCKDLVIAGECWDKRTNREWIKKNAVKVWCVPHERSNIKAKGRYLWRRKDAEPFEYPWKEAREAKAQPASDDDAPPVMDPHKKWKDWCASLSPDERRALIGMCGIHGFENPELVKDRKVQVEIFKKMEDQRESSKDQEAHAEVS